MSEKKAEIKVFQFGKAMEDAHVQIITFGRHVDDLILTRYKATAKTLDQELIFLRCVMLASMLPKCANPPCTQQTETAVSIELERYSNSSLNRKFIANFPVCRSKDCQQNILKLHVKIINQFAVGVDEAINRMPFDQRMIFEYECKAKSKQEQLRVKLADRQKQKQQEDIGGKFADDVQKILQQRAKSAKNKQKKAKKKEKQKEEQKEEKKSFFQTVKEKRAPAYEPEGFKLPYKASRPCFYITRSRLFFSKPPPDWNGKGPWMKQYRFQLAGELRAFFVCPPRNWRGKPVWRECV
jgi:hypothetical protein